MDEFERLKWESQLQAAGGCKSTGGGFNLGLLGFITSSVRRPGSRAANNASWESSVHGRLRIVSSNS
jgi:hypothetical protein